MLAAYRCQILNPRVGQPDGTSTRGGRAHAETWAAGAEVVVLTDEPRAPAVVVERSPWTGRIAERGRASVPRHEVSRLLSPSLG
jgi:hypothetical protein